MKFLPLVWAGLWRKPARTTLTILSLVVAFFLFGILRGVDAVVSAMINTARLEYIYTASEAFGPMPISYAEQIASLPNVRVVAPVSSLGGTFQDPKNSISVTTTDERIFQARDVYVITKEQVEKWRATRNGVIVGADLAARYGLAVGDRLPLSTKVPTRSGGTDWEFEITAIIDDGDYPTPSLFALAQYDYVNEERGTGKNLVNIYYVRVDDPSRTDEISRQIDKMFIGSSTPTDSLPERVLMDRSANLFGDIRFFVNAVAGCVTAMLLMLTINCMMLSFRERIPEFAVLKTIGFSDSRIAGVVILESLAICLLGAAPGLALAGILAPSIRELRLQYASYAQVTWTTVAAGVVVAMLVALISASVPAWKARRLMVVDALVER